MIFPVASPRLKFSAPSLTMGALMDISGITFDSNGLAPVVVQDDASGAVLMLAYADRTALEATARTGFAHFYSRSRQKQWLKGETSGNRLAVSEILLDCDGDAVLYRCCPEGPTCHTGAPSCFFTRLSGAAGGGGVEQLTELEQVLRGRIRDADEGSYTGKMLRGNPAKIRGKVSEEALEVVLASEGGDPKRLASETGDLWFHSLMLLVRHGIGLREVMAELATRRGKRRVPGTKDLVDASLVTDVVPANDAPKTKLKP